VVWCGVSGLDTCDSDAKLLIFVVKQTLLSQILAISCYSNTERQSPPQRSQQAASPASSFPPSRCCYFLSLTSVDYTLLSSLILSRIPLSYFPSSLLLSFQFSPHSPSSSPSSSPTNSLPAVRSASLKTRKKPAWCYVRTYRS
jgi:hypothetical protein